MLHLPCAQVKLFVELFTNKFSSNIYKILRAQSLEEVTQISTELEHNLEVGCAESSSFT